MLLENKYSFQYEIRNCLNNFIDNQKIDKIIATLNKSLHNCKAIRHLVSKFDKLRINAPSMI